ncbi:hypothetical protein [Protaetiibacter intestinalis]|uniref:Uncharacterized protein n=1 Tax=Protaetiibacter intestinalis TaxID=2419774 RepID=A0A387B6P2_9MICO|nr:hypothetical protein [Protaetiibacter intestinalis]AYF97431.1 hypothetical protein D7I47_03640 [Protaetiibacter intestinalis]
MTSSLPSVIPVWVVALVGAVFVGMLPWASAITWIPVVMAVSLLLTFAIQMLLARKEGLVERLVASLAGAFVILVVATGVFTVRALLTTEGPIEVPCGCLEVGDGA